MSARDRAIAPCILPLADCPESGWSDERGDLTWRRLFGGPETPTEGLTAGVARLEPGQYLALHRHAPPELYFILEGEGRLSLAGREHVVKAGDGVFIPGNAEHGILNDRLSVLRFFYTFPVDRFEDVAYVFS